MNIEYKSVHCRHAVVLTRSKKPDIIIKKNGFNTEEIQISLYLSRNQHMKILLGKHLMRF